MSVHRIRCVQAAAAAEADCAELGRQVKVAQGLRQRADIGKPSANVCGSMKYKFQYSRVL